MEDLTSFLPDYVRDFVSQEDLVKILDQQKAQDASLEKLKTQLLAGWQGLGENVGIGSAGTDQAEIGGRLLPYVAEDFARRLQQQGITDLSQAKFDPGAQAAWTPEGKGNVSLVATQDGRLVPVWGSSSDAGKARNIALTLASAWAAPGLAGMLGGGLGGAAGAGALLGGTRAAVTGGDILKGALMGGVTGGIGQLASPYLADLGKTASQAVGGDMLGKIASGAVQGAGRSALGAAMTGDSIVDALLTGAASGATSAGTDVLVKGTNSTLNEYLKDVPAPVRNAVTSAATAGMLGKDPEKAVINSFIGSLMKELPSSTGGKGYFPGYETPGEIQEGFFDVDGPGYMEPDAGDLPDWALDPYRPTIDVTAAATADDWYQEGATPTYSGVPEWDDALDAALQAGKVPSEETSQTVGVTGRRDDLNIDPWLQPFVDPERRVNVTEGEPQTIEVTGKRETTPIPDYTLDLFPPIEPKSIRDIGTVTKVSPDEKLEGTEIKEPDLVTGLPSAKVDTMKPGTKPTTPGTKPATPATSSDPNLEWLAALLGAMGGQGQDRQAPAQVNVARGTPESPFDLMYDLRG